jgi:hypothetical protein
MLGKRRRAALVPVAVVALAAGALAGGAVLGGDPAEREPVAQAAAAPGLGVSLPDAKLAMLAQELETELAAYAVLASAAQTHEASHALTIQLQRHEQALATIATDAARLAAGSSGLDAARAVAIGRTAQRFGTGATAAREAAHSEAHGKEGAVALQAFAADAQRTSARVGSLLALLTAATTAGAYEAALADVVAELEASVPHDLPAAVADHGHAHPDGGQPADEPVPAG